MCSRLYVCFLNKISGLVFYSRFFKGDSKPNDVQEELMSTHNPIKRRLITG